MKGDNSLDGGCLDAMEIGLLAIAVDGSRFRYTTLPLLDEYEGNLCADPVEEFGDPLKSLTLDFDLGCGYLVRGSSCRSR